MPIILGWIILFLLNIPIFITHCCFTKILLEFEPLLPWFIIHRGWNVPVILCTLKYTELTVTSISLISEYEWIFCHHSSPKVNLFFLLNIVRVLVMKLKDTHRAESNMYMKAVRATLILVPLLGIQFVIIPWRPENRLAGEVYDYIMHILLHYQVNEINMFACVLFSAWVNCVNSDKDFNCLPSFFFQI